MANIKNNGQEVIILCNMGYDYDGKKIKPVQKSVIVPDDVIPSIWLSKQAEIFENEVKARRTEPMPLAMFIYLHLKEFKVPNFKTDRARIIQKLGMVDIKDITPQMLNRFHRQIAEETSLSFTAREHLHRVICEIFRVATELGYITINPSFRTFKYEKKQDGKHETIPQKTMERFIKCLENEAPHHRLFYTLLIETSIGRAECANLKWSDIENLRLTPKLKQQLKSIKKDDGYVFAQPNGKAMLP
ncbi:MAG: hypothetical protein RSC74_09205, partial [Hydrogenoanaerobacterium sp.]